MHVGLQTISAEKRKYSVASPQGAPNRTGTGNRASSKILRVYEKTSTNIEDNRVKLKQKGIKMDDVQVKAKNDHIKMEDEETELKEKYIKMGRDALNTSKAATTGTSTSKRTTRFFPRRASYYSAKPDKTCSEPAALEARIARLEADREALLEQLHRERELSQAAMQSLIEERRMSYEAISELSNRCARHRS